MNKHLSTDIEWPQLPELMSMCETSTLQKGIQLSRSGAVRKLNLMGNTATAQVKGTHTYQVSLDFTGDLHSSCNCPAAQYQMLCKHAVAVALTLQEQGDQPNAISEHDTIKQHLQSLGEEAIIEMLLDYLEEDEYAWNAMLTKIEIGQKPAAYSELKKCVTQALPREQIWDWRESSAYFHSAEEQLSAIIESMASLKVEQQWKLINYVAERLNKVLEQIDDSSGDRFGIEALINTHMPLVLANLNWSEQQKAQWMFERLTNYEFDVFPSINDDFAAVWQNNTSFLNLCRQAIEQASPDADNWNLRAWAAPLIERSSDWREVVAIKQKIARNSRDFLNIVDTFIDNQEPLEAEFWLAKARKASKDFELKACDEAQFRLYVALGEINSAWALANRLLVQSPSFYRYQQLAHFKANHQVDDAEFLIRVENLFKSAYQAPNQYHRVTEQTDALVLFYIDNQRFNSACEWVETRKISIDTLLKLADAVAHDRPNNTLSYYLRVVTTYIEQTNNEAYATALDLLQKVESLLKPHAEQLAQFYIEVASLAESYKRKRNMLKLFQQHYAAYL
ncbi:SWIM zinc finger family protein [Vibrio neptunius]|uniref:SWIM zinc finger domain-containing protein n=1 Tax=Vibrio neptunius TaxID=170651 RepID=A0ABS3A510_9VIBR|nr:SWIM zinc finger family protein [Vibrio neptunius]MBN3494163.1 SWIM zinc finger domain-containing protein [Vibrio neptunius]MBN3518132.1 SWIM zinc finger domain-containing protein [Vibrio neptunius]MBN3550835.1 SWIM zinc finger domain-containing protein [Vibrio neptunius]MBN3578964.1 SWIM zinc finger domain-containing protein [Vibrio neptunius]MCH9872629.1 SWIM zinc finger domain-containing protein [Vibrio neptunius]